MVWKIRNGIQIFLIIKLLDSETFESKIFWYLIQNLDHEDFRNKAFQSSFSKYGFESKSNLNWILEPRIFSKNGKQWFSKGFDRVLVLKLKSIPIRVKADAFYSHYKSKAIHHYKNKCIAAWMQQSFIYEA
jgi:hypothetical protein